MDVAVAGKIHITPKFPKMLGAPKLTKIQGYGSGVLAKTSLSMSLLGGLRKYCILLYDGGIMSQFFLKKYRH